jgi:hypothetical protein
MFYQREQVQHGRYNGGTSHANDRTSGEQGYQLTHSNALKHKLIALLSWLLSVNEALIRR